MDRKIPIENLYYLLCYANKYLPEDNLANIDPENCPDSLNMLALVLAHSIHRLGRRGLEQQYLEEQEETARLRGRILVPESRRRMIDRQARMICLHDELSIDCLPNQILRGTCDRLLLTNDLTLPVKKEIRLARDTLTQVTPIRIMNSLFGRVRIHRNNRGYRMPVAVCHLIHRAMVPSEREGAKQFHDIFLKEKTMAYVFENFVRNFATIYFPQSKISAKHIRWEGNWEADAEEVIPWMITDVTIEHPNKKIVLDCKFYKEALKSREGRKRLHSSNLYQMTAYLRNISVLPGWESVQGILLYPAVDHHLDIKIELNSFPMQIVSIDLDQHWENIHLHLMEILEAKALGMQISGEITHKSNEEEAGKVNPLFLDASP
ncbi:MAG: hypothetical protein HOL08_19070 [Opitutae bacterium]|jgi:5-methylcytosine-specific restriction enzyme subunit McrC|nr:hypothetical protein [Opitutae bacterium]